MSMNTSTLAGDKQAQYLSQGYFFAKRFFSEDEIKSLEAEVRTAEERAPSVLNKGGLTFREYLHAKSPFLQQFLSQPKVVDFLKNFIGPDFWLRKDQGVFKKPGGIEFPWHQDNGYNGIQDAYHQLWIPLTPMNPENGGLFIIPKSHRHGVLPHRYQGAHFAWSGDEKDAIPVRAERGDVLIFSSMLLHRTGPNRTDKDRIAYVAEFMSSKHYDPEAKPPFFRVAKDGKPSPGFVRFYRGNLVPQNRLKYVVPTLVRNFSILKGRIGRSIKRSDPAR